MKNVLDSLKNPLISTILLLIANAVSFIPVLQKPYFFMFGVLGNFFLTFCFSFLIITISLNLNRLWNTSLFKYIGCVWIGVYFYLYFGWVLTISYTFLLGYFIMGYGVYVAFRFNLMRSLTKNDFF